MTIFELTQMMEIITEILFLTKISYPEEAIAENILNNNLNDEQLQLVEKF